MHGHPAAQTAPVKGLEEVELVWSANIDLQCTE
jgi:hypothetical protein